MYKKTLTINDDINVFYVGDIHGEFLKLQDKLSSIGFNKETDILISVGDLIDRGENSLACLELITEPWFHAVRGNHEELMIRSIINKCGNHLSCWLSNGSQWYFDLNQEDRMYANDLAAISNELPYVIEVNHRGKKIVVCHANYPNDKYSGEIDKCDLHDIIWDRSRIDNLKNKGLITTIKGADHFVFGHTPVRRDISSGNCNWIDTGAVFGKELTIIQL